MERDEQLRAGIAGDANPLAQGQKVIVIAGKNDLIPPGCLQSGAQLAGYGQRNVLLENPVGADRARIDAPVAGIDRHHRQPARTLRGDGGRRNRRRPRRGLQAHERIAAHRLQVDHQPEGIGPFRRQHEAAGDLDRAGKVDDDPRSLGVEAPVAEALDHPDGPISACLAPVHDREIDDHPVRVVESEHRIRHRFGEIEDEAGGAGLLAHPHTGNDGRSSGLNGAGKHQHESRGQSQVGPHPGIPIRRGIPHVVDILLRRTTYELSNVRSPLSKAFGGSANAR